MKRFDRAGKHRTGPLISAVLFLLTILLFCTAVSSLSKETAERQQTELENALQRGIISCYAMEGRYPESLEQLLEQYPLYYNKEMFCIDYRARGENILPDVTVIRRDG